MFIDQRLPINLSFGSSTGVNFRTELVEYNGGGEYRDSKWRYHKQTADLAYVVKNRPQALQVYEFFLLARGRFYTFRVKDYLDFTSASDGVSAPSAADQLLGVGTGAQTQFQLYKNYSNLYTSYTKKVTKPVAGTILVSVNNVATTDFTVNTTTGVITLTLAPAVGLQVKAGFEFDFHMRFDVDELTGIEAILLRNNDRSRDYISFPNLPVIEVL